MDLINNLIRWIGSINNLQQSISECRSENIKLQNALILLADDNSKIKASLSQLQQENDILRSKADDLGILQQNSGVLFPQFPKLPPEIRRIIWQCACRAPQIHIFKKSASRSKINAIINSCKEARAAAATLQLDWFVTRFEDHAKDLAILDDIKNYANIDIDTIWLTKSEWSLVEFPYYAQWECGQCYNDDDDSDDCNYIKKCLLSDHKEPLLVGRLALSYSNWLRLTDFGLKFSIDEIKRLGSLELLLVVGDFADFDMGRDIVFITPQDDPVDNPHVAEARKAYAEKYEISPWDIKWSDLANEVFSFLQEMKGSELAREEEERKKPDFDIDAVEIEDFRFWNDLREWEVPEVKFVEAVSARQPKQWIRRPVPESA